MRKLFKLLVIVAVAMIFLPTCTKNKNNAINCMITSASKLKRRTDFTYVNGIILTRIADYSDSANVLSVSRYELSYNINGQVSGVSERLENGVNDSISFEYTGTSKISMKQYIQTGNSLLLSYTRNFILDIHGNITSDTVYASQPVRKSLIINGYSTYEYDADNNLINLTSSYPNGNTYFSLSYLYTDTLITNNSYNVARFTCMDHYGSAYQYVFPQIKKLPSMITLTTPGLTSKMGFTYDLDANKNPVTDYSTVQGCPACSLTTYYKYSCY